LTTLLLNRVDDKEEKRRRKTRRALKAKITLEALPGRFSWS